MKKRPKDRHLDVPAEANRDKHVNYLAQESGDTDPAVQKAVNPIDGEEEGKKKKNPKPIRRRDLEEGK